MFGNCAVGRLSIETSAADHHENGDHHGHDGPAYEELRDHGLVPLRVLPGAARSGRCIGLRHDLHAIPHLVVALGDHLIASVQAAW